MKKIFTSKIILIIFSVIAAIVAYNFFKPERLFILSKDRSWKIEVPRDIVKAHDCKAYKEWLYRNLTPMLMPSDRCPWSKTPKGEIGEFEINGVKLYVPRNYLLFDKKIPDGDTDGITLLMKYPDMTPAGDDPERNDYYVRVSIDSKLSSVWCSKEKPCIDASQIWYENLTDIGRNLRDNKPNIVKILYEIPKEQLIAYKVNTNGYEYLLRGDPLKPNYWLKCHVAGKGKNYIPHCETTFNFNDKIYVNYSFSRDDILPTHDELRAKIISKINEFQQLSKEP